MVLVYSSLNETNFTRQGTIMNIAKNMEIIFVGALALASASTLAHAAVPARQAVIAQVATTVVHNTARAAAPMTVVTITAKRLSAAQKAALGN
jgi:hypothetical protein